VIKRGGDMGQKDAPVVGHEARPDGAAEEEGVVVGGVEEADEGGPGGDGGPKEEGGGQLEAEEILVAGLNHHLGKKGGREGGREGGRASRLMRGTDGHVETSRQGREAVRHNIPPSLPPSLPPSFPTCTAPAGSRSRGRGRRRGPAACPRSRRCLDARPRPGAWCPTGSSCSRPP